MILLEILTYLYRTRNVRKWSRVRKCMDKVCTSFPYLSSIIRKGFEKWKKSWILKGEDESMKIKYLKALKIEQNKQMRQIFLNKSTYAKQKKST